MNPPIKPWPDPSNDPLTVLEVMLLLKKTKEEVIKLIEAGQLEAIPIGEKDYRIRRSALNEYLRRQGDEGAGSPSKI